MKHDLRFVDGLDSNPIPVELLAIDNIADQLEKINGTLQQILIVLSSYSSRLTGGE